MQSEEDRARRFRAYVAQKHQGIFMRRSEWDRLVDHVDEVVEIDIRKTPLAAIASEVRVVGSFLEHTDMHRATLTIVREDPGDHPNLLNLDRYEAGAIGRIIDFESTVASADTDIDPSMKSFVNDYVLIVPADKGEDHHLEDLPQKYSAVLQRKSESA